MDSRGKRSKTGSVRVVPYLREGEMSTLILLRKTVVPSLMAVVAMLACMAKLGTAQQMPGASGAKKEEQAPARLSPMVVKSLPILEEFRLGVFSNKISTVTGEQIEALAANDLADALRRVPGVTISRFNMVGAFGGGEGGSFTIRGHGWGRPGSGASTMVGGVSRFNGIWTHPLLDTIAADMADKIEVYKSPQPVLFGNMAFGAVNLAPKRHTEEGFDTEISTRYGSYETFVHQFEHGGRIGRWDYYVNAVHRESDGHRDNADGEVDAISANIGYDLSRHWDAVFRFTHTEGYASDPRAEGAPAIPRTEQYHTDTEFYSLKLSYDHQNASGFIKAYYEDGWAKWEQWDEDKNHAKDHYPPWDNYGVHARETLNLWDGNRTTIGLDYDIASGKAKDVNPTTGDVSNRLDEEFRKTAPYALLSQAFDLGFCTLTPSAGARYTDTRYFDDEPGYQAGISAERGNTEVYGNFAHSVNYPGIYAAMFYENYWSFLGNPEGWKDIDPETMDHWEIGITQQLTEWSVFDISGYYDSVEDGLRIASGPPPAWLNVGEYTSEGVEAKLEMTPVNNLTCFVGGNYTNISDAKVPHAPEWSWSSGITYSPTARLTLNVDAEYTDEQYAVNTRSAGALQQGTQKVASYTLVNAKVSYAFAPKNSKWDGEFFIGGKNITDEDYEYQPGYPMPGVTGYTGMKLRF